MTKHLNSVGQAIRTNRLRDGWGQQNFAIECGMKPSELNDIEEDHRLPTTEEVLKIITVLGDEFSRNLILNRWERMST